MLFICKRFQSSLQAGHHLSYKIFSGLVHVKTTAAFITRVQYLAETLLSKIRLGKRQ